MSSHNEIHTYGSHALIDMPQRCDCRECNILKSLLQTQKQQYDFAFCAGNLPFDLAFASLHTTQKKNTRNCVIQIQQNKPFNCSMAKDRRILVIGSYYNVESINELYDISSHVTHYVMSHEDLKKFPKANVFPSSYTSPLWNPSWLFYLYRRETKYATDDDHALYRGILHKYNGLSWDQIARHNIRDDDMIEIGKIIMNHISLVASDIVRDQSRDIQCGPYRARLVVHPGPIYVSDIVRAAADDGYDIGITMRHYKNGYTRFSFYSNKSYVDMSFLHQKPYDAGGDAIKGLTVNRIVPYVDSADTLEKILFGQDMLY